MKSTKLTNAQKLELIKALERKIMEANRQIGNEKTEYENKLEKNPPQKAKRLLIEYIKADKIVETTKKEIGKLGFSIENYGNETPHLHIGYHNSEIEKTRVLEQKKLQKLEDVKSELRLDISFADSTEDAMKFVDEIEKRISAVLKK